MAKLSRWKEKINSMREWGKAGGNYQIYRGDGEAQENEKFGMRG